MAAVARLRRLLPLRRRFFSASASASASSILNPSNPSAPLTSKQKSRAALSLLKSERDPDRILSICRAAALSPASHLDRSALSLAVTRLSASQSFPSIRSFLSDLLLSPRPDLPPDRARAHAIVLFGQAGMLEDSLQAFKASPGLPALNALLFAAILSGRHADVSSLFRDLPAAHRITPNLDTYNTVVKAFCESGSARSVYSVLDEMLRMRIKPNLTTFNTWLAGLYKEERFEDVPKVLELMKKHDCHPSLSTYNTRIQSLCKIRRAGEAKALFKELVSRGVKLNWVTYNHLIFGFCNEGDFAEAKKLYAEMKRRGCVPDSSCYFTLIHYLCKGGDFEAALGVCRDSMARNWVPCFATMKMLVNGLVSRSKVEDAKEILGKVKEKFSSNAEMWKEVEDALPQ